MAVKGNVVSSKLVSGDTSIALKSPRIEVQRIILEIEKLISNIKNISRNELEFYNITSLQTLYFIC